MTSEVTPTTPAADAVREAPPVSEAIARYLRVCSSGGMPRRYVDIVQLAVEDAERLGYFNGLATARESALVAERDAYKDRLFAAIEGDEILAYALERIDGTDRISPMQMSELLDVASANLARAQTAEAERDALRAVAIEQAVLLGELSKGFKPDDELFTQIVEVGAALDALAAPAVEGV